MLFNCTTAKCHLNRVSLFIVQVNAKERLHYIIFSGVIGRKLEGGNKRSVQLKIFYKPNI